MNEDPLEQLLRDADAGATPPAVDANLAERVRTIAKRRQRVRAVGGSLAAVACAVAVIVWVMRPDAQPPRAPMIAQSTEPVVPAIDVRAELLALSDEADRRAALAEAMWAAERRARRGSNRAPNVATTDVAAQVERAAFTMVYQAARMPAAGGATSPAADVYRQVMQSFPQTRSGEVARQRLSELQNRKDG